MSIAGPATHLEQERMEHTLPFVIGMELDMTHIVRKCDLSPVTGFVMFLGSVAAHDEIKQIHKIIRVQSHRFLIRSDCFSRLSGMMIEKSEGEMTAIIQRIFPDKLLPHFLCFGKLPPEHEHVRER